MRVIHGGSGN